MVTTGFSRSIRGLSTLAVILALAAVRTSTSAQDKGEDYPQHVVLKDVKSSVGARGKSSIEFVVDLHKDIPRGTNIEFVVRYLGLPHATHLYELKSPNRKNVRVAFQPKEPLVPGQSYELRVRFPPEKQKKAVLSRMLAKRSVFPKGGDPWPWLYLDQAFVVGTPAQIRAEKEKLCGIYGKFIDQLIDSYVDIKKKLDKMRMESGDELNRAELLKIYEAWQKNQGGIQQKIHEFPQKNLALIQMNQQAYIYLSDLGRMVSKAGFVMKQDLEKAFSAEEVTVKKPHKFFSKGYRPKVNQASLDAKLASIEDAVCPQEEPPPEEGDPKDPKNAGKKDPKKKDPAAKDATKKDSKPSSPKKGSGASTKKDSGKKSSSGAKKSSKKDNEA